MTATLELEPFSRQAGDDTRDYLGHLFTFLADSRDTDGRFALIEATVRKGLEPPPHTHSVEDETYIVLEGDWTFDCGGHTMHAGPGACVFLPRGVQHSFSIGADGARALILLTPGGLEEAFRTMSQPAGQTSGLPPVPEGPPPIARMLDVFGARGITFAPPPPAGLS
jgi:quercetin dioxygenase-like cupin family protein